MSIFVFFTNPVFNIPSVEIFFYPSPQVKENIFISPCDFFLSSGTTYFLCIRIRFPFIWWRRDTCYLALLPGCLTGRHFIRSEAGRGPRSSARDTASMAAQGSSLHSQCQSFVCDSRWQEILMCRLAFICSFQFHDTNESHWIKPENQVCMGHLNGLQTWLMFLLTGYSYFVLNYSLRASLLRLERGTCLLACC